MNTSQRWIKNGPADAQLQFLYDHDKIDSTTKAAQILASNDKDFDIIKSYSKDVIANHLKTFFENIAMKGAYIDKSGGALINSSNKQGSF